MGQIACLDWLLALASLVTAFLLASVLKSKPKVKNLPPGPPGWPVIGNLLQLGRHPPQRLAQLAAIYGPVMSLQMGSVTTVVVSSASATKELLQTHDLTLRDREVYEAVTALGHHHYSPIWMPGGPQWRRIRKISNSHIFSHKSLDNSRVLRQNKVKELVSYVEGCSSNMVAVDIGQAAFNTGLNFMSNTIFSVDLVDSKSDTAREFKQLIANMAAEIGAPNLADHFPVLKTFDPQGIKRRMNRYLGKARDLINGLVDQRINNVDGKFHDILATLLNISSDADSGIDRSFIVHIIMDLFFGGTETTSSTIEWAMAELLRNPEKMKIAREELHTTIGKGNSIKETHISGLPYLEAVVKETLRLHPPVPLVSRKNTDSDLGLSGFSVPKDSRVWINIWGIGRDPRVWDKPQEFEPERFLGSECLDIKGRDFEVIPFGSGRRICAGMSLALRMVPLMLGALLNTFDWKLENGVEAEDIDMEDKIGLTLHKATPLRAIPIHI